MLDTSDLAPVIHVIQSSLTPIFLLSAIASLLSVFTTRLARVSDQVKALSDAAGLEHLGDFAVKRRLAFLRHRSHALEFAVILGSFAGACTCATVLALFLSLLRSQATSLILFGLFGIGVLATIGALGAFLVEVMLAARGLRADVDRKVERINQELA